METTIMGYFEIPAKGSGSGKNGKVVKRDVANGLLTFMFGPQLSKEDRKKTMDSLIWVAVKELKLSYHIGYI